MKFLKVIVAVFLVFAVVFVGCKKEKNVSDDAFVNSDYVDLGLPSGTL